MTLMRLNCFIGPCDLSNSASFYWVIVRFVSAGNGYGPQTVDAISSELMVVPRAQFLFIEIAR
jgi:hypothetical protein